MIRKTAFILFLVSLLVMFSGCATMGPSGENEAGAVIDLIGSGDSGALKAASRLPFLLDGEILLGETELVLLWDGLASAGFAFNNPVIEEILPAAPEHYILFGNSMDVEVFFMKYLAPKDVIVRFSSDDGDFIMLISSRKTGSKIASLKGGA